LAWRASSWSVSFTSRHEFSISIRIKHNSHDLDWWLTLVYGPSCEDWKDDFLAELNALRNIRSGPWLLCGDFNWIYKAKDKNNDLLDRCRMGQFRCFLNDLLLKEIHLQGRLFTWSNKLSHPTLE
jgi:hypothetical protein